MLTLNCIAVYGFPDLNQYFVHIKNLDYHEALKYAEQLSHSKIKRECLKLAKLLYFSGQEELNFDFEEIQEDTSPYVAIMTQLNQGYFHLLYRKQGKSPYEFFTKAYVLSKDLGYQPLTKFCLLSIIRTYNYELNRSNSEALDFFGELNAISTDNADLFNHKINLALFYLRDTVLHKKLNNVYIADFSNFMKNFDSQHNFWPNYYATMGVISEALGNLDKADKLFWKALDSSGDKPFLKYLKYRSLIHLSEIMRKQKKYGLALDYIKEAKKYGDNSYPTRVDYYSHYYAAPNYFHLMEYTTAFESLQKAHALSLRMISEENNLENSRLKAKYENDKKEKQILVEQQRATKNRNWFIAASIALLLGAGIAILLQKNTRKKRQLAEQEALLKQQSVDNLLKEQELVSIDAMIAGQEKERKKVAGELHDDLGSLMATIKLHFDNIEANKKDPALQHAKKLLEEAYHKVRGMAHHKHSGVMSDQGLLPAIKKMASTISKTGSLEVTVEDFGLGDRMENSLELSIFRIIQELTANAIKHAAATQINIQLTQHEDNLNIIVADNGKGFDPSKVDKDKTGMGLTTIEKRIEHLEGNFTIDSILGKGTSILIDIPV